MKILRVDLQKAKNNIKNKIEGYPRVERGNISFSFCKRFWNIPTPLLFSRNAPRQQPNIFTWTTLCLQRIIIEICRGLIQVTQKKTCPRKNWLHLQHSVFWPASGWKSPWNMTANQKTANQKYFFTTIQRKKQNLVFEHMIWQVNVSCPPSSHLNTRRECMIAS